MKINVSADWETSGYKEKGVGGEVGNLGGTNGENVLECHTEEDIWGVAARGSCAAEALGRTSPDWWGTALSRGDNQQERREHP